MHRSSKKKKSVSARGRRRVQARAQTPGAKVEVRDAGDSSGNGVFARVALREGEVLTRYGGALMPRAGVDVRSEYVHPVPEGRCVVGDGNTYVAGACGHMVNDSVPLPTRGVEDVREYIRASTEGQNVRMRWDEQAQALWVTATRPICPGEQLRYAYGPRFWLVHQMHACVEARDFDGARECEDRLVEVEVGGWVRRLPPKLSIRIEGTGELVITTLVHGDAPATEEECRKTLLWYGVCYDVDDPHNTLLSCMTSSDPTERQGN
jgi:hypothetical protein